MPVIASAQAICLSTDIPNRGQARSSDKMQINGLKCIFCRSCRRLRDISSDTPQSQPSAAPTGPMFASRQPCVGARSNLLQGKKHFNSEIGGVDGARRWGEEATVLRQSPTSAAQTLQVLPAPHHQKSYTALQHHSAANAWRFPAQG